MYRLASTLVLVGLLTTACQDRYRDPCGTTREETTTTYRTKNKALGWTPTTTHTRNAALPQTAQSGSKC